MHLDLQLKKRLITGKRKQNKSSLPKDEISNNKMLKITNPKLRRVFDIQKEILNFEGSDFSLNLKARYLCCGHNDK